MILLPVRNILICLSMTIDIYIYYVPNIIVGAGGCSAAYFINDLMGGTAKVDVYSNDKVGGRIAVIEYGGRQYEAGASILHKDNQYMAGFASMFGEMNKAINSVYVWF